MNCKLLEESSQIFSMNFNIQRTEMPFHNVGQGSCKLKQTIAKIGKKIFLGNKSLYYKHFTFIYNFNEYIVKYAKV